MDKQFDAEYINTQLEEIGKRIAKPIKIYLIGGCAMSFRGLKESTKDVDIVFKNKEHLNLFLDALFGVQYFQPVQIKIEHEKLEPMRVYENKDGFHLDLFIEKVVGKLHLSDSMIARAELYKSYESLSVYLLSKEDIFLFKGLASESRERDLLDMRIIYPNINWGIIEKELNSQKLSKELTFLFIRRLERFREVHLLDVPLLKKLK